MLREDNVKINNNIVKCMDGKKRKRLKIMHKKLF